MSDAIAILREHGLQPSKGLGQNFVVNEGVLDRIVEVSSLDDDDVVLEVGPGVGLLTRKLARQAGRVVAVELDERLLSVLEDVLGDRDNVSIVHGDILKVDPVNVLVRELDLCGEAALEYQVVANLPYYITSAVLRHLLEARVRPRSMTLMVQYEVAKRIVAEPGEMSLLSLGVQVYAEPHIAFRVSPGSFYPSPQVESAVIRLNVYPQPRVPAEELDDFFRVARAGFAHKRKQLCNSLAHNLGFAKDDVENALKRAGVDPRRRPQALEIDQWARVERELRRATSPPSQRQGESNC